MAMVAGVAGVLGFTARYYPNITASKYSLTHFAVAITTITAIAVSLGVWRGTVSWAEEPGEAFKEAVLATVIWIAAFFAGSLCVLPAAWATLIYVVPPLALGATWFAAFDPRRYHRSR